jgi:hypothetical protein
MGTSHLLEKLFSHGSQDVEAVVPELVPTAVVRASSQCSRCHRSSHQSNNCHAKKDFDGNLIDAPPTVSLLEINAKLKSEKEKIQKKKYKAKKLLKTKNIDCDIWKEGKCTKGENCMFSHKDPNGFDPRSKQLCHFHKLGSCVKGKLCEYSHNKKDFPCVYFYKKELSCKHDRESCEYHHDALSDADKLFLDHIEQSYASKQANKVVD